MPPMINSRQNRQTMFPTNPNQTPSKECIQWVKKCIDSSEVTIQPLPEHAHKQKHYYTLISEKTQEKYLLVESLSDIASMLKFITLSKIIKKNHIETPEIYYQEISTSKCWVIMSHFGHETLLDWLTQPHSPDKKSQVLRHCLSEIHKFQKQKIPYPVSDYSAKNMFDDMSLTDTHFIKNLLETSLSNAEKSYLAHSKSYILEEALKIPSSLVHFDFHSANIMLLPHRTLGILDFQDLKIGPICYDLMSLLTDHYYFHNEKESNQYIDLFYDQYLSTPHKQAFDKSQFHHMCRITSIQRHLKNIGIFSRLFFNSKPHYIKHIPGMMHQLNKQCSRCTPLKNLPEILWSEKIKSIYATKEAHMNNKSYSE